MLYTAFPTQDTYISWKKQQFNFGSDPVLSMSFSSSLSAVKDFTRALVQFDINQTILNAATGNYSALLTMFNCANSDFVDENFVIEFYPIIQQWSEGKGSDVYPLTGFANYINRSATQAWSTSGGSYTSNPSGSFTFNTGTENLTANISSFIEYWKTNSNYGILFKFPTLVEGFTSATAYQNIKTFFGGNTHTYFKPRITIRNTDILLKDDIGNLHLGNNNIFVYDSTVAGTAYPGNVYISKDLTLPLTAQTSATLTYFGTNAWYFTYNNLTDVYQNGLWIIQSNTSSSVSVTASVTGTELDRMTTVYTSDLYASVQVNPIYYLNDITNIRAKVFMYTHRGVGSVVTPYFPTNVFITFKEKNSNAFAFPEQEMNYNRDGYYVKMNMNNFVPDFYYVPSLRIVETNGNVSVKQIPEAKIFVKAQ